MRDLIITLLLALGGGAAVVAAGVAQNRPELAVLHAEGPVTAGIGIHARHPTDADLSDMKAAGFRFVRTDLTWSRIEKARGVYDWQEADHRIAAMWARGLRPVLILDYSNPLYATGALTARSQWPAPRDSRGVGAFTAWATAAASRYARYSPIWELWNEPDGDVFWPPNADPGQYLALAESSCAGIRSVDGRATIWAPALSSQHGRSAVDSSFLKTVLDSSLPSCLSAISVHPYTSWREIDSTPEYWNALRALAMRAPRPFVSSESGISRVSGTRLTDATQASYLVRMLIYDHMVHLPVSIWYNWRNDGPDPTAFEDNYGLMDFNDRPKPAFMALAALIKQTNGLDRECLVRDRGHALLYGWRQNGPDQLVLVAWSTTNIVPGLSADPVGSIDVNLPGVKGVPSANDLYGQSVNATQIGPASWRIGGSVQPYYIHYTGHIPTACT
jgi:hypothetical protein